MEKEKDYADKKAEISADSDSNKIELQSRPVKINKHIFVWIFCLLFGCLGADRFARGQIALGIIKLCFWWITLGIWPLVDWIISLIKAYNVFFDSDDITFINGNYAK
jgi:TM2 domain-containing membrane protein YozV